MKVRALAAAIVIAAAVMTGCSVSKDSDQSGSTTPSSSSSPASPGSSESSNSSSSPGTTAPADTSPLVFGAALPLSGVVGSSGNEIKAALEASAKTINDAGGINGRQVQWKFEDNGFPSGTQASVAVRALVSAHVLAVLNFGTPGVAATYDYLKQQGVLNLILFAGLTKFEPLTDTAASIYTDYKVQGQALADYLNNSYADKTVAVLYQNDDLGTSYLNGFKSLLKAKIVTEQSYVSTDVDFSSQLNAMKASGADIAACFCLSPQIAQVLKFRQSSGWNPAVVTESSNAGQTLIKAVGADLTDNVLSLDFFPPADGPNATPDMTAMMTALKSANSSLAATPYTIVAAALMDVLKQTISKMSGEVDTKTLAAALHTSQLTGAWYGTTSSWSDSPARSIFSCWKPNVIKGGEITPVGDKVTCESDLAHG